MPRTRSSSPRRPRPTHRRRAETQRRTTVVPPRRGHRSRTVGDVMHRGIVHCDRDTSAAKVATMMTAHRIHAVVVTGESDLPRLVTVAQIADLLYTDTLESS